MSRSTWSTYRRAKRQGGRLTGCGTGTTSCPRGHMLAGQVIGWQRRVAVCQTAAMAERAVSAVSRRVWGQLAASPRAALERGLNPADLQAALMDVSRSRAAAVTPARLMQRWRQDRYVQPDVCDPRLVWPLEARLWELLPDQ